MAAATGYESLLGYELYDVHGATEDWNYIEQGALGYTVELGPRGGSSLFMGPYETHVVDAVRRARTAHPRRDARGAARSRPRRRRRARPRRRVGGCAGRRRCCGCGASSPRTPSASAPTRRAAPTPGPVMQVPDFVETTLTVGAGGAVRVARRAVDAAVRAGGGPHRGVDADLRAAGGSVVATRALVAGRGRARRRRSVRRALRIRRGSAGPGVPRRRGATGAACAVRQTVLASIDRVRLRDAAAPRLRVRRALLASRARRRSSARVGSRRVVAGGSLARGGRARVVRARVPFTRGGRGCAAALAGRRLR